MLIVNKTRLKTTTTTFFQKLFPFPWTKRQPNRMERPKLWSLVVGPPLTLPNDLLVISVIKCKMRIHNSRSKKTI